MPSEPAASLPLLVLSGSAYEVGRQYGALMRQELAQAVSQGTPALQPLLTKLGLKDVDVRQRMAALSAGLPSDVHEELQGMSDASGLAREALLEHALILDIVSGAPIGCSQFAVLGQGTATGNVLHGHNLDVPYPSLAKLTRPCCIVYRVTGRIPYASITFWPGSLGVCAGMNAEGLSLGINVPVAPMDRRPFYPLTFQNREVLSRARTMDEAAGILESLPRGGSWNLMLAHRSGAARVWEQVGPHSGQYTAGAGRDFVVSTNHLTVAYRQAKGHEAVALEMLQEMQDDSIHRYRRLEQLIGARWGRISLDTAVEFLRDCGEPSDGAPPSMKTICRVDNVLSMAYEPATLTMDFAAGEIPAALERRRRLELGPLFQDRAPEVGRASQPPGQFPMLGTARAEGGRERTFVLEEDHYLREHLVNGTPVLPGAAAIEWLAEVAALEGAGEVAELRDVSLEKFIRVRPDRPTQAHVRCEPKGGHWEVSAYADLHHPRGVVLRPDVLHYRAAVRLGSRADRRVESGSEAVRGPDGEIPFSRSYVQDAYFHVGEAFRRVDWISFLGPRDAIGCLRMPEPTGSFASIPRARYWMDPFFLDGCFQLVGTLGILHNQRAPVPKGIGRLSLGQDPKPGERLWCRAVLTREEGDLLYYDFTVWNDAGALCLEAEDYCSISVDAYTPEQKASLVSALDPSGFLGARRRAAHG
ncbi:C45 family autoproteolytic acyltransferase/hydrolase [Corallococcus sp. bb12-1]|uniref:C45 family autoproteolytic acyltransferase/hydolase n=1 Tax=Corallococcus sp. bb12-1 TaxID=2996784 RepID=UPI00226E38EB|nr:C45 family autoproteolytic acyltransferase/hydolase [Corallococcus sp. bb12-1]MCY1042212.1 C45 family autoproteolytic acyltransferase/hydrolase [Corallococcus sp. bb12-1]